MDRILDQTFRQLNFKETPLITGEYDNCTFENCDLSEVNLSNFIFADCTFTNCNLSLSKLQNTIIRDVKFKDCKMLGLRLDMCNTFGLGFSFDNCTLNHSVFYQLKLKNISFTNSQLQETDFTGCDLNNAVFSNCNLLNATFEQTILEKADFKTAYNYNIDPELNRIKKAKFSLSGIAGLLAKYDIIIDRTT